MDNKEQYDALVYLEENSDSYNFWDDPQIGSSCEVLVPPHMFSHFTEISDKLNLRSEIFIKNFQSLIDAEEQQTSRRRRNTIEWTNYYTVDEIYAWLSTLPDAHANVTLETIGKSSEGRDIKLLSIVRKPTNRGILIEANIHAREWITSATTTWIINELLTSTDPEVVDYANNINWYIIPIVNPDGLTYTKTTNRNWRKTRAPVNSLCYGVDGNRNFGYNWLTPDETGSLGASTSPCTDLYAGPSPLSEPEVQAVDLAMARFNSSVDVFLSHHSYGHWMLHPFGHLRDTPIRNEAQHMRIGNKFSDAIFARFGVRYAVGNSNVLLYGTSGSTPDHAYGKYNIPIAWTVEMRGNGAYGSYGFVLPPNLILPNCLEYFDGLKALIKQARVEGYLKAN